MSQWRCLDPRQLHQQQTSAIIQSTSWFFWTPWLRYYFQRYTRTHHLELRARWRTIFRGLVSLFVLQKSGSKISHPFSITLHYTKQNEIIRLTIFPGWKVKRSKVCLGRQRQHQRIFLVGTDGFCGLQFLHPITGGALRDAPAVQARFGNQGAREELEATTMLGLRKERQRYVY